MKITKAKAMTDTRIRTGTVRLSYPHLFEKYSESDKYQTVLLIPKDDETGTLKAVKDAVKAAAEQGKQSKWGGKVPKNLATPLHDGDESEQEAYQDCYYLTARTSTRPQVVDTSCNDILDTEEIYAGCYARATLRFFPYSASGNNGIGVLLDNVQKLSDGDPIGGGKASAESDFGDDDLEDDDDLGI